MSKESVKDFYMLLRQDPATVKELKKAASAESVKIHRKNALRRAFFL